MNAKRYDRWQVVILTVLALATLASLLMPESWLELAPQKRVEISVLPRQMESEIWSLYRQGMEQAAEDCGAELRFLTPTADNDSAQQLQAMQRELQVGVDAMIVAPVDNEEISAQLAQLRGLPVIAIETAVEGAGANVVPDAATLAQLLVDQIAQECQPQAVVLLVNRPGQCSGIFQRLQMVKKLLLEERFDVQVTAVPTVQQLQKASAVVCFEQQAVHSMLQQLEQSAASPKVYGCGATKAVTAALEQGALNASAVWSEYAMGYLAVQQATAAAQNKQTQDYLLPISLVKKGETYDAEYQKLLYPIAH